MIRLASSPEPHPGRAALQDFSAHTLKANVAAAAKASQAVPVAAPSPLAYAPLEGRLVDIAIEDWNELFHAVEARLKATVGESLVLDSSVFDASPDNIGPKVQRVVLECVTALEQLHSALTHERGLRHQLELEVFDAQSALAQALAQNMGAHAAKLQAREQDLLAKSIAPGGDVKSGSLPSSHGFAAMLLAYKTTGGTLRGDDLSRLLEQRQKGAHVSLAKLIVSREIFSFEWNYNAWVPMFQFEPGDMSVRQGTRQVLAELASFRHGWGLASWFIEPNPHLKGRLPVNLMSSELPAVIDAARAERLADTR